jgi:membrane-bound serine protease (ClpP class)
MMDPWIWMILLLVVSLALACLEMFLPSGGILAFLSLTALIASIAYGFMVGPIIGFVYLIFLIIVIPLLVRWMIRWWPSTRMGKRLIVNPDDFADQEDQAPDPRKALVGKEGVARSRMMPSGMVEVERTRYDAISDGVPIDPGQPIRVLRMQGTTLVVRPVEPLNSVSPSPQAASNDSESSDDSPMVEDPFEES